MNRILNVATALAVASSPACNDDAPDGSGLVIETMTDQPQSADFGVLVSIHARGGRSLLVSVEAGSFVTALTEERFAESTLQSRCFSFSPSSDVLTIELAVRPVDMEALLTGTLFAGPSCSSDVIQSRIVAVHPPPLSPPQNPAVDAGLPDGANDANVPQDAVDARTL